MRRSLSWLAVIAGLAMAAQLAAAPIPLEVLGNLPSLEDLALSPDGSRIAFVRTQGEDRILVSASLADRKSLAGIRVGQSKLRALQWADNSHLILSVTTTALPPGLADVRREWAQLLSYDVTTQKSRNVLGGLIDTRIAVMNTIIGPPMIRRINGETVLYVTGLSGAHRLVATLFRIPLASGIATIVQAGAEDSRGWFVDSDGHIVGEQRYRNESQLWTLIVHSSDHSMHSVTGREAIDVPTIEGIAPDGRSLWVKVFQDENWIWKPLSLSDASWGDSPPVAQGLDSLIRERYSGHIIGGRVFTDRLQYTFFDEARRDAWASVLSTHPHDRVHFVSASDDFKKIVVLLEGPEAAPEYQLIDLDTDRTQSIGSLYNGLSKSAEVRPISYSAQDGLRIPAYLTLPPDRAAHNLPLVVMPHGGPAARDTGGFDWWAQALALQGYAVLQPNYRGSELGRTYLSAGFGQWGRKMQSDLTDGVHQLAADGLVDPKRVCIVGASYGGYAALAGVSLESGVYRCAVAVAGISDLHKFLDYLSERTGAKSAADRYTYRFLGASGSRDPVLDAISPINHVDAIVAPVLLIHGRDDTVVPFEQSALLANALKKAGKPVSLIELKQEDHWLSHGATRLQMLQATEAFLTVNNPPD
jgi:dipeptidyl aminopeptidase/acylaminoacyl peptidase